MSVSGVFPRHKHLMIKRSQRCRKCEHNLSKPEYNPSSIKFKIQLAAYYHVPEVVLFKVGGPVKAGAECSFVLKVANPTQHPTKVEILGPEEGEEEREKRRRAREEEEAKDDGKKKVSILRNPSLVTASSLKRAATNASVVMPATPGRVVYVPPRDDAAEFDDAGPDLRGVVDDKNVVLWRRSNKVQFNLVYLRGSFFMAII